MGAMLPHVFLDDLLGAAPPLVTALLAIVIVSAWQFCGASLLAQFYDWSSRGRVGRVWAFLLGWATWLPVSGALALLIALLGIGRPWVFRGVAAVVVIRALPACGRYLRSVWAARPRPQILAWIWWVAIAIKVIEMLFASHPQRQYDQLSYHLVVAKILLNEGRLPIGHLDMPLFLAGPVEYAFAWLRAFVPSDLFELGAAQFWVYLAAVPASIAAIALSARRLPLLALTALLIVPAVIPSDEIMRIAKPNAALMAGAFVMLAAMRARRDLFISIGLGLGLMMIAANQTFLHAGIAFLGMVLVVPNLRRRLRWRDIKAAPGVLILGVFCLVIAVSKSMILTGTPFFPASARFIPSPLLNEWTAQFWASVAASGETSKWSRFWGAPATVLRSMSLTVWLLAMVAAAAYGRRKRLLSLRSYWLFIVCYGLSWPLFYGYAVFARFVTAYIAGVIMLGCSAFMVAPARLRKGLVFIALSAALAQSGLEVVGRKMFVWNQGTLNAAIADQYPRFETARWVNRWLGSEATIVTDDPAKLFFDQRVLGSTLSPREQSLWKRLTAEPQAATKEEGIAALVVAKKLLLEGESSQDIYQVPVLAVWNKLYALGRVVDVGADTVLYSNCLFARFPCDDHDREWTGP